MEPWSTTTVLTEAGLAAYDRRAEIAKLYKRVLARLGRFDATIAVTGMPGAGKTVLVDHLTGVAFKKGYVPPAKSLAMEKSQLYPKGSVISLNTIPGQHSDKRRTSLDKLFDGKKTVDGVIHVVSNGFVTLRSGDALQIAQARPNSLEQFRAQQRALELDDFKNVAGLIRPATRRNDKPSWLLLVVDKIDLFFTDDQLRAAHAHYAAPGGAFHDELVSLRRSLGDDRFDVEVLPVFAWGEEFKWGAESILSRGDTRMRDELIEQVLQWVAARGEKS